MPNSRTLGITDLAPLADSDSSSGRGMVVGNVPSPDGAIVDGTGALTAGYTNLSAVDALAVNTAETAYQAATGTALDGAGLKIGILSDSFNLNGGEAAEIANGDLPAASDIHILQEGTSGNDEGQALAELIHSIAPDAQIYFYSGTNGQSQMAAGINALVSAGVNVIVDDITYTNEPFFQDTGVITQAAEAAVAAGVSYFTSAGNSGSNYYQAGFSPMTFALPGIGNVTTNNVGGGSPYEAIQIGADATLDMTMEWTQPFGDNQYDLGMALYSYSGGTFTLVRDFTTSSLGGDPVLTIDQATTLAAGTYYMAFYESGSNFVNNQPVTPGTFKIIAYSDSDVAIDGVGSRVGSGTSIGHELAPGVNSVAAVGVADTPAEGIPVPIVEPYSSAGDGQTYINAAGATLATPITDGSPDFAATDGSPTSVFDPFYGTSAAAANAAAVGLLVLQADTRLTPAQVTDVLEASAIPSDSASLGGAGLIQASTAVAEALLANETPIWTGQGATTLWGSAANWSDGVLPQGASNVVITNGLGLFTGAYSVNLNLGNTSINSLDVDGGTLTGAQPQLVISAGDTLAAGSVTIGAGTVNVAGAFIDTGAMLTGSAAGLIDIQSTGSVTIAGSVAAENIAFVGTGGRLAFTTVNGAGLGAALAASISNFQEGDVIDIRGLAAGSVRSVNVNGASVTFINSSGAALASLDVSGATNGLSVVADGSGGTELVSGLNANYQNLDVAGLSGPVVPTVGGAATGLLQISNVDSLGATTAGEADVAVTLPGGYNALDVSAPGNETIAGNGAANFTATFEANASVTFTSNGGSGTVTDEGSGDFTKVSGTNWTVTGAAAGADTINSSAASSYIATYGQGGATGNAVGADTTPSNVVGLAGANATVSSNDSNGLIETFSGNDIVSVNGSANVLVNGGADTVYATAGSTAVRAAFNLYGGTLDFINNSGITATVSGAVPGASGGSCTAFGGSGGGVYIGGYAGNNSLVGGSGSATLVAAGTDNFVSVSGFSNSYATQNLLNAGAGGATLIAGASTGYNEFYGGEGTDIVSTAGSGMQSFYVGAVGSENITGSTASGATNQYFFNQDDTGGGQDVITNFRLGIDHIYINANSGLSGVEISGVSALGGGHGGSIIYLSDNTTIQLYGVSAASLGASVVGATSI